MNKRKTIIAAIILALVLAIGGTIAYFTDKDQAKNTFTIGKVDIKLVEENWNPQDAKNMIPGDIVSKDPKIENVGTTPAFVYLTVKNPCIAGKPVFKYEPNTNWAVVQEQACTEGSTFALTIYNWGTDTVLKAVDANGVTEPLFKEVKLNETLSTTEVQGVTNVDLEVYAFGVQSTNLDYTEPGPVWTNYLVSELGN